MIEGFARWLARWLARRRGKVMVQLTYEGGGGCTLGPMTRFAADIFVVNHIMSTPYHLGRAVTSARIVS